MVEMRLNPRKHSPPRPVSAFYKNRPTIYCTPLIKGTFGAQTVEKTSANKSKRVASELPLTPAFVCIAVLNKHTLTTTLRST